MVKKKEAQIRKNSPSLNWFKNVAKSLGYTSTELVQSLTPSIGEFITSNADYTKEMIDDIKSLKSDQGNKFSDLFKGNQHFDIARTALKNAIEDIKSGKIYNKERQEALFEDDFSLDDFSFDDSMEVEVEKTSGESEVPVIKIKNIQPPISPNNPLVKAMQKQSESTLKAVQITNEVNMNIAANQMALNRRIGSSTLQGLQSINENLALLVNFHSESMSKYVAASLKYYEDSLNTLNSTLEELKRSNSAFSQNNIVHKSRDAQDIFLPSGALDMRSYMAHIKKNLNEQFSSHPILQPLKMIFEDTDTLKMLAASPLSFISTKIVTALIPQFLHSTMTNLDKTFSAFFPALMMRINRLTTSPNLILQLIGEIFGVKTTPKSSVDLSRYNRGQIPFDGETKKAIVEVIPTYLRKILSTLNGREEIAFDYDKGQFRTVISMKEEFERIRNDKVLSAYREAIEDIKRRSEAFVFKSQKDKEEFTKGVEKFFKELTRRNHLVNPNLVRDKNGNVRDELSEVFDFGDRGKLNLFRQLILTMPKDEQMRLFGQNVLEARRLLKEMMEEAEENPSRYNANVIFNNAGFDEHLITKNGRKEVKKGYGLFNPVDKFNYTSLDYLRDIKLILLEGIKVFPLTSLSGGTSPSDDGLNNVLAEQEKRRRKMLEDQERLSRAGLSSSLNRVTEYTPEQIRKLSEKGLRVLDSSLDLYDLSDQDIVNQLHLFDSLNNESGEKEGQKKSLAQWVGKFIKGDKQQKFNLIREQIDRIVQKPAQLLKAVFDKIDNTLYTVVFGSTDKGDQPSFMDRTMAALREKLDKLTFWVKENVFEPVKEFFVGENGIVNKFKQSDFYKDLVEKSKKVADILFGKQGPDGKRRDGLLSDVGNNILDTFDSIKYYFTGKAYVNRAGEKFGDNPNSVFGEVKTIFNNFKTDIKHYLFGKKEAKDPEQQKGALTGILNMIKEGVHNFKEAIFGPSSVKTSAQMTMEELKETIKQRAPKALAWGTIGAGVGTVTALSGGAGLLGSLFLPGGPIGAAIVGTTLGFISQSDRFKDWLFGEKDARGERIGGIISKSTQDFFRKHRLGIIGGATFGAINSLLPFGILPSFFLPGGPIAGAIFGIGTQMILRSEGFQRAIFGEKGVDGKRYGGLLGKVFANKHDKNPEVKKYLANMGVGALGGAGLATIIGKFGLLGAMFTPFGPVGGAIAGLAAGIAVSTDKWKKALFGEWDEETGLRKGGLLGKFNNWFKLEVVEPMKLKFEETSLALREWFTKSMAIPFQRAINPIKQEFKYMTDTLTEWFKKGWDSFRTKIGQVFEEHVGKPFGKFMQENVMKPLKSFLSKIIGGIAKIFRPIVEAPVKVVSAIGDSFRERQERRGLKKHIEDGWKDIADYRGIRERGERMGLFRTVDKDGNVIGKGLFGRIGDMHFRKEARDNARYGEHGASYARQDDEKFAKILAEKQEEFDKKRADIEEKRRKLQLRRDLGLKYDYENFDEQGRDISRIYNITKSTSAFKRFVTSQGQQGANQYNQSIQELTGLSVAQILGRKEDDADVSRLSRNERKRISKAIKSGFKGNALMKFLGIEGIEGVTTTPEQPATSEDIKESTHETTEVFKTSIETMTEKVTEALKESSSKSEIKETIVPKIQESNNYLATIAFKIGEVIGQKSRVFKAKKLGVKATNIPNNQGGQQSVRNQIDVEGTFDERDEQIQSEFEVHHEKMKKRYGYGKLDKDSLLMRIATDVRIIASEVSGQLDGVGSNVYKIRKTLQNFLGISDDSIQGSANRDRVGFLGKIRRALFKPIDLIREKISSTVGFVVEKVRTFGSAVFGVAKSIVMVPFNIAKGITKGIGTVVVETGKFIKTAAVELIKLPGLAVKGVVKTVEGLVEGLKTVFPAIGKAISGVVSVFTGALKGFGKGLSGLLENLGKGLGKLTGVFTETLVKVGGSLARFGIGLIDSFTKLGKGLIENTTKLITKSTTTILDFTLSTVKTVGDKLIDVGKSLFEIVTSPIKFLGNTINKFLGKTQEVTIKGGTLDVVKEVYSIGGYNPLPKTETSEKKEAGKELKVTIVGAEEGILSRIGHVVKEALHSLLPLPVIVKGGCLDCDHHGPFDGGPDGGGIPLVDQHSSGGLTDPINNTRNVIRGARGIGRAIRGAYRLGRRLFNRGRAGAPINLPTVAQARHMRTLFNVDTSNLMLGHSMPTFLSSVSGLLGRRPAHHLHTALDEGGPGFSLAEKNELSRLFASRKNADYLLEQFAIKEEREAINVFRKDSVKHLGSIDLYTQKIYNLLEQTLGKRGWLRSLLDFLSWLMAWLHNFRLPDFSKIGGGCCGGSNTIINNGGTVITNTNNKGPTGGTTVVTPPGRNADRRTAEKAPSPSPGPVIIPGTNPDRKRPFPGTKPEREIPTKPGEKPTEKPKREQPTRTIPKPEVTNPVGPVIPFPQDDKKTREIPTPTPKRKVETPAASGKVYPFERKVERIPVQKPLPQVVGGNMVLYPGGFKPAGGGITGPVMMAGGNNDNINNFPGTIGGTTYTTVSGHSSGGRGGTGASFPNKNKQQSTGGEIIDFPIEPYTSSERSNRGSVNGETRMGRRTARQRVRGGLRGLIGSVVEGFTGLIKRRKPNAGEVQTSGGNVVKFPGNTRKNMPDYEPDFPNNQERATRRSLGTLGGWIDLGGDVAKGTFRGGQRLVERARNAYQGAQVGMAHGGIPGAFRGAKDGFFPRTNVVKMPRTGKQILKGAIKGAGGLLAKGGGFLSRVASNIPLVNLAVAGVSAVNARQRANEIFGLAEGEEATGGQKLAATLGGGIVGLIPGVGLVDYMTGGMITDLASKGLYKAGSAIGNVWEKTKNFAGNVWDAGKTIGIIGRDAVTQLGGFAWEKTKNFAGKAWDGVQNFAGGVKDNIQQIVSNLSNSIEDIKKKTIDVWTNTKENISKKWEETKTKFSETVEKIKSKTTSVWNSAKETASKKWEEAKKNLSEKASKIASDVKSKFESAKSSASKKWDEAKKNITEKAGNIAKDASTKWDNIKSSVSEKWDSLKKTITDKAEEIGETLSGVLGNIKTGLRNAFSSAKSAASKLWDKITGKGEGGFGIGGPSEADERREFQAEMEKWGSGQIVNGMVYYSQKDPRWANKQFTPKGKHRFGKAGCGPTSAAMVLSSITGKEITPIEMHELAQQTGFVDPNLGTNGDFFLVAGAKYGVNMIKEEGDPEKLKEFLQQQRPVILRGEGAQPFTRGGHFIVASGLTRDGKVLVNDPMDRSRSRAYNINEIVNNTTRMYVSGKSKLTMRRDRPTNKQLLLNKKQQIQQSVFGSGSLDYGMGVFDGWKITSGYGYRKDPFNGSNERHKGLDLVKYHRAPVQSFTNGTVVYAGWGRFGSGYSSYGNVVAIRDEYGYTHVYGHLDQVKVVVGSKVKAGTVIGLQGNTGRSTGSHLHYEVRRAGYGTDVDPMKYLQGYKGDPNFKPELIPNGDSGLSSSSALPAITSTLGLFTSMSDLLPEPLKVFNKLPHLAEQFVTNFYLGNKAWTFVDPFERTLPTISGMDNIPTDFTNATIKGFKDSKPFKGPYANIINKYAQKYNLEPQLIAAIIRKESNFNPWAVSHAGARGLMQLMPATARSLGVRDPFDPEQNIAGGTKYIRQQINSFKDLALALAAYNAGPGNVKKYGGIPPFSETRNYVNAVIGYLEYYRNQTNSGKGGVGGGFEPAFERKENLQVENVDNDTGSGEITKSVANRLELARVQSTRIPERISSEYTRPQFYDSRQFNGEVSENDLKLLKDVIDLLKDIANNTKTTYQGIDKLASQQENRGNVQQNIIVPNNQPQPSTTIINGGQNYQQQANYSIAKTIAGGRI